MRMDLITKTFLASSYCLALSSKHSPPLSATYKIINIRETNNFYVVNIENTRKK